MARIQIPAVNQKPSFASSPIKPAAAAQKPAGKSSGKLQCHLCDRTFSKASYLKSHLQSHPNSKPFKCEICGWGNADLTKLLKLFYSDLVSI